MSIKIKNIQNNIKMLGNATNVKTPTQATIPIVTETMTNNTNTLNTIHVSLSNNEQSFENIIHSLQVMKVYIIIIAIGVLFVIAIKMIKMCTKAYHEHNEVVIKKHNRVSPEL